MTTNFLVIAFQCLLFLAACFDLLTMTIPNWISALTILLFVVAAISAPLPFPIIGMNLSCAALVLGMTLIFFRFGWMGGGDAKLATATALWFGWRGMLNYFLAASALGGLLAIAILALRRRPLPAPLRRVPFIARLADDNSGLPYGVALSGGALLTMDDSETVARLLEHGQRLTRIFLVFAT